MFNLRWRDIGAEALHLPDGRTGPRSVPLGGPCGRLSARCPDLATRRRTCFPDMPKAGVYRILINCWRAVCEDAKRGRLRLHDLRGWIRI